MKTRSVTETRECVSNILRAIKSSGLIAEIGELYNDLNRASAECPGRQDPDVVTNIDDTAMLPIAQSDAFIARARSIVEDTLAREQQNERDHSFIHGQKAVGS